MPLTTEARIFLVEFVFREGDKYTVCMQERFKEQFETRPKTLDDFCDSITDYTQHIPRYTLQRMFGNMMHRIDLCVEAEGHHFQHKL